MASRPTCGKDAAVAGYDRVTLQAPSIGMPDNPSPAGLRLLEYGILGLPAALLAVESEPSMRNPDANRWYKMAEVTSGGGARPVLRWEDRSLGRPLDGSLGLWLDRLSNWPGPITNPLTASRFSPLPRPSTGI